MRWSSDGFAVFQRDFDLVERLRAIAIRPPQLRVGDFDGEIREVVAITSTKATVSSCIRISRHPGPVTVRTAVSSAVPLTSALTSALMVARSSSMLWRRWTFFEPGRNNLRGGYPSRCRWAAAWGPNPSQSGRALCAGAARRGCRRRPGAGSWACLPAIKRRGEPKTMRISFSPLLKQVFDIPFPAAEHVFGMAEVGSVEIDIGQGVEAIADQKQPSVRPAERHRR